MRRETSLSTHLLISTPRRALLTCELQTIFDIAKPNPTVIAPQDIRDAYGVATGSKSKLKTPEKSQAKHKKPDDDCAICYEAMEGEEAQLEAILVWCDTCDKVCLILILSSPFTSMIN